MTLTEALLLAAAGVFTGVINVVAGGGSLLIIPLLIGMGVPATVANATTRLAIVTQNVAAVESFRRRGVFADPDDRRRLALLLGLGLPGAAAGAWAGVLLNRAAWGDAVFERVLAAVMIALAVHTWRGRRGRRAATERPRAFRTGPLVFAALGIGVYVGLIQAGVGFIIMAVLLAATPWNVARVNGAKALIAGTANALALAVFAAGMEVAWDKGLVLALGQTVGGWFGGTVSSVVRDELLLRVYVVLLIAFAVVLAF